MDPSDRPGPDVHGEARTARGASIPPTGVPALDVATVIASGAA